MVQTMRKSFRESIKALEADIQFANTLASEYRRQPGGACFQMRLSYSPASCLFRFLVQWTDCYLAGALGLLRVLIYICRLVQTYADGKNTMYVHEKKASIRQFYGVIFPSLLQLQTGIPDLEDRKQKEPCAVRYRRYDAHERGKRTELEKELEEECGICMEMNKKVVLPNCCHSLCFKCYQDWFSRSQSCPYCRDALKQVKPGDLWVYTDETDTVDLSVILKDNVNRLFNYFDKLPVMKNHHPSTVSCNWHAG
ncbi:E3 ubiquitin-protein ligase AIRP2-like isoform X2 [Silene latifolia]|uniref:E3 ubiquitin-protein ligase AIRP2-like isoform X2 n=1 Tax=Silene latifolia TaxID=37657 RepID=UPI003D782714